MEEGTVCSGGSDPLRTALRSRAQDRAHNTCKGEYGHVGTQPCGTIYALEGKKKGVEDRHVCNWEVETDRVS